MVIRLSLGVYDCYNSLTTWHEDGEIICPFLMLKSRQVNVN